MRRRRTGRRKKRKKKKNYTPKRDDYFNQIFLMFMTSLHAVLHSLAGVCN
jgi:hypothetical protein